MFIFEKIKLGVIGNYSSVTPFPQEMKYRSEISEQGLEDTKVGLLGAEYRNKYKNYFIKLITLQ